MRILVVNAGSSSLKLQVLDHNDGDDSTLVTKRHLESWDGTDVRPVAEVLDETAPIDAVGHRVVHGGPDRTGPALIDDELRERLGQLLPLAPLHQNRALAGIAAARTAAPEVPQVACFDTTYHATLPEAAGTYALPETWRDRWPLRRFGFHGLSHAYAARRASALASQGQSPAALRVVTCHLGAGASLCASRAETSVDTTMGFTPLEGLVMATRSGTIDPGLVLWLVTEAGLAPDKVRDQLEHASGLAGLAGTSEMQEVLARRQEGDSAATLAFDVYTHVLGRHVAAMTPALGGLDLLVFTAGVGEGSPEVREAAAARLAHLGVSLDASKNEAAREPGDHDITAPEAAVTSMVIEAREDLEIARRVQEVLTSRL